MQRSSIVLVCLVATAATIGVIFALMNGRGGGSEGATPSQQSVTALDFEAAKTVDEVLLQVNARIRETIEWDKRMAASYVRLGFHDCVPGALDGTDEGGCDGCLNFNHPANNRLEDAVEALAPIVADFENSTLGVSRADIWGYAALVASEVSQNDVVFTDDFKVGRQNCESVGTCIGTNPVFCASNGPDQESDFPGPDLTTHELLDFMAERFGFNADQTVAIMGGHTLGRALADTSGFDGEDGWVDDEFELDNDYFRELVGGSRNNNENTDLETLADGPNWDLIEVDNTGRPFRNMFQWVRGGGGGNEDRMLFRNLQRGGRRDRKIMLNVDIAIVRDLGVNNDLVDDGDVSCSFKRRNRCPLAETLTKAGIYRGDNNLWLSDFKDVMIAMGEKGLENESMDNPFN